MSFVCHETQENILYLNLLSGSRFPLSRIQVSLSTFAYMFGELIEYNKDRVESIGELETRLSE